MKKQMDKNQVKKLLAIPVMITMMSLSLHGLAYANQPSDAAVSEAPAPETETQTSETQVSDTLLPETPSSKAQATEAPAPELPVGEVPEFEVQSPDAKAFDAQAFEAQGLNAVTSSITIDGYYDDWEDMPMGKLTWNNNNGNAHHDVSFIKDDNYIYIYLGMHPSYQSPIPIYSIYLTVNNQTCQLFLAYANDQNTPDWSRPVNLSTKGTYLNLHPFTYYPNNSLGDAAVTVSKGNPNDKLEIRININDLEKVMGLKEGTVNSGSQLELRMPNVGGGSIQLLGTSTGTILGILLCIGIVVAVKLRRSHKARLA